MNIYKLAKEQEEYITAVRRAIHANPELGGYEFKTTAYIKSELEKLGIDIISYDDITGCIGVIKGNKSGKTVMLRADIDALAITEENDISYKSKNAGVMHACGHDAHTAMLLGAAKILSQNRDKINGTVKLIFQMGEEIGRKSEEYVKRGALNNVDAIFGMHIWSLLSVGKVSFEGGERMACSDRFTIQIKGQAAHGSAPHLGRDAIVAAAASVIALQSIPSRSNDSLNSLVVTVGMMNGGRKENILCDRVELVGTVRTFDKEFRNSMPERIEKVVSKTAESYGCTADCSYYFGPSPLINDHDDLVKVARGAAKKIMGEKALAHLPKMMGAEDFSVYTEHIPGFFGFLGTRNEVKGITYGHHHPRFNVDESILFCGTAIYVQFAIDYLAQTKNN